MTVDFRSDTVTRPTAEMKQAMHQAPVGDDVFGEDPSINELEQYVANLFGMEAALFVPSGTMSNQLAIKVHTQPGDDIICDYYSHIYQYEGGGIALNAGCATSLINSEFGLFGPEAVEAKIHNYDIHKPISRLVSLENTVNKAGGIVWDVNDMKAIKQVCNKHNLAFHLDGARLFNAMVATNTNAKQYGHLFHTISICLSKGLGAPVGSVLVGSKEHIFKARRYRKVFGGGMRQAGGLAAAGLFALQNNVIRLADDHKNATAIGETLSNCSWVKSVNPIHTNIVIFEPHGTDAEAIEKLAQKGIKVVSMGGNKVRFVTHLDITDEMMEYTLNELLALA